MLLAITLGSDPFLTIETRASRWGCAQETRLQDSPHSPMRLPILILAAANCLAGEPFIPANADRGAGLPLSLIHI